MRHLLFLLFMAMCAVSFAQYPATGNKARLGWQTTADGLVYRGAIGDTTTLDPSGLNNAWMLLDTASGNLFAYRAKAWRLVSGGGGGSIGMPFDSVTFNVNENDASLRELKYSEEKGYLQYGGQDSVQIPLLPGVWYVRNDTSVTIPKGTVVRASGTLGASGRIKVKHMIANGSIDAMYILGIAMHDIAVGADGYAMSQGKIRQVNTQAYSEGAVLYADVDTLGGLTQTEPGNGFLKLPIAFVVHSASNGVLAVRVTSGAYMRDLHDVEVTSPATNASLYYNTAQGIWRDTGATVLVADTTTMLSPYLKKADTTSLSNRINLKLNIADTSVFARDFQISGTTNRLAMFTGTNTVGNSVFDVTSDTVSIRDYSNSYTMWRYNSNVNKGGFVGWPTGTRFYSLVNSSSYAGFMYGDRSRGIQDQQAFTQLTAYNGGGAASGFFSAATTLNGADSTLYFNISGLSANANPSFPTAQMVIQKAGNVGIGTASPTAKLHINNPSSTTPALNIVSNSNVIGSTNDAVSINMQPGQVNQNNTGVRIFNTTTGTSAEGNNTGIAVSLNARNNSYGVYSAVSKNWGGALLSGEAIGIYGSATTDSPAGFSYGGYFKNDTTRGTGFGAFIQTTTPLGSGTVTPLAVQHNSTELMRVQSSGNVGINTTSPARPLHVAGTSAIRIPSGITDAAGSSAVGDIRHNSTLNSLEWYNGSGWFRPASTARTQVSGMSTRFAKYDANGLLDTSAILIQANNRIGIFNSPAASDSALTVTGGIRATTGATAARFTATGSTVPTNGMYLPATNALAFSTNTTERVRILSDGKVGINVTPTEQLQVEGTVRAKRFSVNTFGSQVVSINNYAPEGSLGQNLWIGDGGQSSQYTSGQSGGFNVSLGLEALKNNTTGFGNMAIGAQSLASNTTGYANVAIGTSSLLQNTAGLFNIAIGSNTCFACVSSQNTAIGYAALQNYSEAGEFAGNNTAIGTSAEYAKTTGAYDVAIGWFAGRYINTTFGTEVTSSNSNIFIGAASYPNGNAQTGQIVIGAGAVGNGSNTTTIGNSSTTATIFQYGETRLGMAVDSGAYRLQVNGDTKLIGNLARKKPVTIAAATYTVLSDDSWLIANHTAQITITLPTAASSIGRELMIKYVAGGGSTVISNATNVSPIVGGALTNIILPATAGSWVTLVCDGVNWIIMQKG